MAKFNKTFSGTLIFIYAFSAVFCSLPFSGLDWYAENDHSPHIHCGIDLNNYAPSDGHGFFLFDLTSCWSLIPESIEPHLPILSFSIFKIPKAV
jgi:hypothetical protein